jgi:acetyl esterase/lipase
MPTRRLVLILAVVALARLSANEPIRIWPEGVPGRQAGGGAEYEKEGRTYNVQDPTLTAYPPEPGNANGCAIILCPGGGYTRLAIGHEGGDLARWLRDLGVTAFVLKYRLKEYGHPAPLQDVLRAVRLVRSQAADFGIDPHRIGLLGGSAGGHLAASAGTLFDHPAGRTGAPLDNVDGRPDFLMLLYPVISMESDIVHRGSRTALLGTNPTPELLRLMSLEHQVTARTPPAFLMHTQEDASVVAENSIRFYQALVRAGVPAELHLYPRGPHGVGMRSGLGTTSDWPKQAAAWLKAEGWLAARPPAAP